MVTRTYRWLAGVRFSRMSSAERAVALEAALLGGADIELVQVAIA